MTIVSVVIVVLVVAVLAYITINKKQTAPAQVVSQAEQNTNMQTQQIEGVKITILKEGTGAVAKSGDTVAMNYTGTLADGSTFDSNVDPKFQHVEPFPFILGAGQVIKGWDTGIVGMKVGEQRKLEIAPDFAYGASGHPPVIPPNATLTFTVELLAIK